MMAKEHSHVRRHLLLGLFVFVLIAIPISVVGYYYYTSFNTSLTNQTLLQRQTVAALSASAMALKLNRLVALAQMYAAQPSIQTPVAAGKWPDAVTAVKNLQDDTNFYDYYIDRVLLFSTNGIVEGAFPGITPGKIGSTTALGFSDWSVPVLQQGAASYVSNVYQTRSFPQINVVYILVPIKNGSLTTGVLCFEIPTNEFSDFGKDVDVGDDGFAYFVDGLGHIVTHPKFSGNGPIVDYSSVPSVALVIKGETGIGVFYNAFEQQNRLTAYEPVPGYSWGVIAQEPASEAFAARNATLDSVLWLIFCAYLVDAIAVFIILSFLE